MSKRLEIYSTFKCNNNCLFCVEKENREKYNNIQVFKNKDDILTKLKSYKDKGYNHLNLLGGEPFIENNIIDILETAKSLNFSVALATNGILLADEKLAKECLPLIDDLIISIHGHNKELIEKQSQNKNLYDKLLIALKNIKKYFKGRLLKANCVINALNYKYLLSIFKFIANKGIREVNFTAMEILPHNEKIAVNFNKLKSQVPKLAKFAEDNHLILKFSDIPLCFLGDNYILSNHLFFDFRDKFNNNNEKDQSYFRKKIYPALCIKCQKKSICQGLDINYFNFSGDKDLASF